MHVVPGDKTEEERAKWISPHMLFGPPCFMLNICYLWTLAPKAERVERYLRTVLSSGKYLMYYKLTLSLNYFYHMYIFLPSIFALYGYFKGSFIFPRFYCIHCAAHGPDNFVNVHGPDQFISVNEKAILYNYPLFALCR